MRNRLISVKKIIEKEVGHRIDGKDRYRSYTYARAVFCKIAREMNGPRSYSLAEIGQVINRDHASVLHNLNVIFPFAVQESSFNTLYLTMKAMFIDSKEADENFDEVKTLAERVLSLEKENASLTHKLDLLKYGNSKLDRLIEGLSKEEMQEVHDKMNIFVKAIKNRVYL